MTVAHVAVTAPHAVGGGDLADRVAMLLDPAFLAEIGWDETERVVRLPAEHPLLGRPTCRAEGCAATAFHASRICRGCQVRLAKAGLGQQDPARLPPRRRRRPGRCVAPDCPRTWASAVRLCQGHMHQQQNSGVPIDEFVASALATALPRFVPCAVLACTRDRRTSQGTYCHGHEQRWRVEHRRHPELNETSWQATAVAITEPGTVSLRGLPPLATMQVLFGLQQRTGSGRKTNDDQLRALCNSLRRQQVASIDQTDLTTVSTCTGRLTRAFLRHLREALGDPESEQANDVWNLAVFGHRGSLPFTPISQSWLQKTAKRWAVEEMAKRRGRSVGRRMRRLITYAGWLSDSLRMRPDRGDLPTALGRADIDNFCNRLAYRETAGQISRDARIAALQEVRTILARIRAIGLTRPGEPAGGLGEDFVLLRSDIPSRPDREPGRDLPVQVMRHLCDQLPSLEQFTSIEVRVAVELLIDTGRRPEEICGLPFDCLVRDADGTPVLVYDNGKADRRQRRLPIGDTTAQAIITQQQRVRARYPHTPIGELKLLPSNQFPRAGRRSIGHENLTGRHRRWITSLPTLHTADGVEFDKTKIVPYAYRHTYAQRHADAGVPPDVLRALMDHRDLKVTQRYYRVGEQRRRDAVDRVTALQFDRHGNRIWRDAKALLDSEHARRAVGEVAVPFGVCAEPSNVRAGGHACPYRFRCVGCDHFRTDASYLPDLQAHLDDLLRTQERLRAATDVDAWVHADAAPSHEEINRTRRLINRIKGDLEHLTAEERAQIDQAVATVRQHRTVTLGVPRVRQPLPDVRPHQDSA